MKFRSTRGQSPHLSAEAVILQGVAPDGGLYLPESFPRLPDAKTLRTLPYAALAAEVLAPYFTHIDAAGIETAAQKAYARFSADPPLRITGRAGRRVLELFHGPTLAFKDMALCLLPHLMQLAKKHVSTAAKTLLLTATSGDTGVAAMEGFADMDGFEVIVFYPLGGVSPLQERQMLSVASANTTVIGLEGNFDDAQRGVKAMLGHATFKARLDASGWAVASANSINLGRLLAQIVYYVYTALHVAEPLRFFVPTGNFGNVLAAHWAGHMGLSIEELVVATNDNCVLDDFFCSGEYEADRPLIRSQSPSMDILVSSNLERLLAEAGADAVREAMQSLEQNRRFSWPRSIEGFSSGRIRQAEAAAEIRRAWREEGELLDPHTAVASALHHKRAQAGIVVATASPFKFPRFVLESLGQKTGENAFEDLKRLSDFSGQDIPKPLQRLETADIVQKRTCTALQMEQTVREVLDV